MTSTTTDRNLIWIVLAIVAVIFVLPAFGMGMMGFGGMHGMGGSWMWAAGDAAPGWVLVVGAVMHLLGLLVVLGVGYALFRALVGDASGDEALAELRRAYARGDLSDEEFERRRERLEGGK